MLLGVDTGGTFTDFVLLADGALRVHKVLSTPEAPERAILQGISEMGLEDALKGGEISIIHGSTVATNAALERKGARTVFVTNSGLGDMLSIGRQTRAELYNLTPAPVEVPVPKEDCLEVGCRIGADGERVAALTEADIEQLQAALAERKPEAVAINLLFSFVDDSDEKRLEAACPEGVFVSRSSFVLPEYREYERGMATWLNAYLGPKVAGYLARLQQAVAPAPLGIMQSSGGTIDATQAGQRAVNLLLSGPAGGLAAAHFLATALNPKAPEKLLTFDMGGTSTDVAMIKGALTLTSEGCLGPFPVAVPMVDMHTIGAGGGSLAAVDAGGLLQVGPASAGASPGPACYGKGGNLPTVTDANAVLGRLKPEYFLGGAMALDNRAAERAVDLLAGQMQVTRVEAALGVIRLANEHMARALRVMSVQRGYRPGDFTLCCFGGAGGLHVCDLAETLGMSRALVPIHGGVLSALGMLVAPRERQLSRSLQQPLAAIKAEHLAEISDELASQGKAQLCDEGVDDSAIKVEQSLDVRYQGQSFALTLAFGSLHQVAEDFARAHRQRYGHTLAIALELVNIRVRVWAPAPPLQLPPITLSQAAAAVDTQLLEGLGQTAIYERALLPAGSVIAGPALICEQVSTTLVAPGWQAQVDAVGNLVLSNIPAKTNG